MEELERAADVELVERARLALPGPAFELWLEEAINATGTVYVCTSYQLTKKGALVCKLGYTTSPVWQRLAQIETGHGRILSSLLEIPGSMGLEQFLHDTWRSLGYQRFKSWYNIPPGDLRGIAEAMAWRGVDLHAQLDRAWADVQARAVTPEQLKEWGIPVEGVPEFQTVSC